MKRCKTYGMNAGAFGACAVAMVLLFLMGEAAAAPQPQYTNPAEGFSFGASGLPVDIKADQMEYDRQSSIIRAIGNVVIRRTNEVLQADWVELQVEKHIAHAKGHVIFRRDKMAWKGEEFTYNFLTKEWQTGPFTAVVDPFHVQAQAGERVSEIEYRLHDAILTTCTNSPDHQHFVAHAQEVSIIPGDRLRARKVTFYLGDVPIMYSPVWHRDLGDRTVGLILRPGYRSNMGVYLLSGYNYRLIPGYLKATTHVDLRSKRGLAGGQDFDWSNIGGGGSGSAEFYIADDLDAEDDHPDEYDSGEVTQSRYRARVYHRQPLSMEDYLLAEFNYLNDPYVISDFFESEYRQHREPENYVSYVHHEDNFAAGVMMRTRLNDFYTVVERLPEVTLDFTRQEIPDSPFYFESHSSATILQKVWAEDEGQDDYSATRLDSQNLIYYPGNYFGFLSVIPRAGYRATYYSTTLETYSQDVVEVTTNASGDMVLSTNTITRQRERNADLRSLFELGFESSFKAFRTWETDQSTLINGIRHIVEPYMDYTFVPTPNIRPDELYQFDSVDSLDKENNVRFGVRNKIQTKRDGKPWDLIDIDLNTVYNLDPDSGTRDLENVNLWTEITPVDYFKVNIDGSYNTDQDILETFNLRTTYVGDLWRLNFEYRYRDDNSSLIIPTINIFPDPQWTLEGYARYEAEDSRLEEHGYVIQRNLDCMSIRFGFSHLPGYTEDDGTKHDDDYRVELAIWLLAFPHVGLGTSTKHRVEMH